MVSELEIPTLSTNNADDDDYHSAITGVGAFSPETNPDSTRINSDAGANNGNDRNDSSVEIDNTLTEPMIKSGIGGASANLVNSIVGAGIIGIPYAFKQSGLIAGVLLLVLVAFLTDKSLRIIVGLASFHPLLHKRNVQTFEDLAAYPFGDFGSKFILLNMFVLAYGAMIAYLLIIKDTIPSILAVPEDEYLIRNSIMFVTSILIMVPLSMQRDMASLAITSIFSVAADVLLVIFIASYAPIKETVEANGGLATVLINDSFNPTLFIGLGILSTAMACQHSAFIVSGSLENKTMKRWATVTAGSIAIATILCLILGIAGYLGFLEATKGDVLNNFDTDDLPIAKFAKMLLAITMFFTYPMESFVARHVLIMLFHHGDMDGKDDPNYAEGVPGAEAGGLFCLNRRQTWTWGIYVLTLIPALFVDDIGPVLSITGSVGGGSISYLAPGLVYIGVNGDAFLSFASSLLQSRPVTTTNGYSDGGEMSTTTATLDLPIEGTRVISTIVTEESAKPIWWYLAGFPIWCAVATIGRTNMRRKIAEEDGGRDRVGGEDAYGSYQAHSTPPITRNDSNSIETEGSELLIVPSRGDYFMAVFFIIFGTVAIVAGLTSNIWMIIKGDADDYNEGDDASANANYYEN